jgi:Carboxypeptidase regulatory-like domain
MTSIRSIEPVLSRLATLLFAAASIALAPSSLQAQFTSVIEGRIADPSDAGVSNAEITIERPSMGIKRVVRASDVGYFRVQSLPPGQFSIRVSAPGFDSAVIDSVLLENDQTRTINVQLKIGTPTTQVPFSSRHFAGSLRT